MKHAVGTIRGIDKAVQALSWRRRQLTKSTGIKDYGENGNETGIDAIDKEIIEAGKSLLSVTEYAKVSLDKFESAIKDDINMPVAWRSLFELINNIQLIVTVKPHKMTLAEIDDGISALYKMDAVFGVIFDCDEETFLNGPQRDAEEMGMVAPLVMTNLPAHIINLVNKRTQLKAKFDFVGADELREELLKCGYRVIDDNDGKSRLYYTHVE
jgi:cysteinyl-tRNA synthetase